MRSIKIVLSFGLLILLFVSVCHAFLIPRNQPIRISPFGVTGLAVDEQLSTHRIEGYLSIGVFNLEGKPIPKATVYVETFSEGGINNVVTVLTTYSSGYTQFVRLKEGEYYIQAEAPNGTKSSRKKVTIRAGQVLQAVLKLDYDPPKASLTVFTYSCEQEKVPATTPNLYYEFCKGNITVLVSNAVVELCRTPLITLKTTEKQGSFCISMRTNDMGLAKFQNLDGGWYQLKVRKEDYSEFSKRIYLREGGELRVNAKLVEKQRETSLKIHTITCIKIEPLEKGQTNVYSKHCGLGYIEKDVAYVTAKLCKEDSEQEICKSGETNSYGELLFKNLEPGIYRLSLYKKGYLSKSLKVKIFANEQLTIVLDKQEQSTGALKVYVYECNKLSSWKLTAEQRAAPEPVQNKCGANQKEVPIYGAYVSLCSAVKCEPGEKCIDRVCVSGTTNSEGIANFKSLRSGLYDIKVSKKFYTEYSNHVRIYSGIERSFNVQLKKESKRRVVFYVYESEASTHEIGISEEAVVSSEEEETKETAVSERQEQIIESASYQLQNPITGAKIVIYKSNLAPVKPLKEKNSGENPEQAVSSSRESYSIYVGTYYTSAKGVAVAYLEDGYYRAEISKSGYKTAHKYFFVEGAKSIYVPLKKITKEKRPVCKFAGTRSEGWYIDNVLIKYDDCACEAVCKFAGTRSEGWYSSCTGRIIRYAKCSASVPVKPEPTPPQPEPVPLKPESGVATTEPFTEPVEIYINNNRLKLLPKPSEGITELTVNGITAVTSYNLFYQDGNLYLDQVDDSTRIKVLPDEAASSFKRNYRVNKIASIELSLEDGKPVYVLKGTRVVWSFFDFRKRVSYTLKIDAQSGKIF